MSNYIEQSLKFLNSIPADKENIEKSWINNKIRQFGIKIGEAV